MKARLVRVDPAGRLDRQIVQEAAEILLGGGLVVLPTETVYGVAACTRSADGLDKLRLLKERPPTKPFALMVADGPRAQWYAPDAGLLARRLMRKAWPGPLTIVVEVADPLACPAARRFGPAAVAPLFNQDKTIGLRCPNDPVARGLLEQVDGPVVAASANRGGQPPALTPADAMDALGDDVDLVLDAGPAQQGVASTVIRIARGEPGYTILRQGLMDARTIDRLAVETWLFVCSGNTCRSAMAAGMARARLAERLGCRPDELPSQGFRIESGGISAGQMLPASAKAVEAAARFGVDLSGHRTRRLTVDAVRQADRIYVMTDSHRQAVLDMLPSAAAKTRLLWPGEPIEDPMGGGPESYRQTGAKTDQAVRKLVEDAVHEALSCL